MPRKVISAPIASPGFGFGPVCGFGVGNSVETTGGTVGTGVGVATSRADCGGALTPAVFFAVGVQAEIAKSTPRPAAIAAAPATLTLIMLLRWGWLLTVEDARVNLRNWREESV